MGGLSMRQNSTTRREPGSEKHNQPRNQYKRMTKRMIHEVNQFCAAGLSLVAIPPDNGKPTKAPRAQGWNQPRSANNPGGYSAIAGDFLNCEGINLGLYHGASNTLALDLDDVELARRVFEDTTDLQLLDWLENNERVEIKSPKANRGKLLFKLPMGFDGAGLRQFKHDGSVIFELRSGNCQDVIYGQHPEGGNYQLIGNPAEIPEAPPVLLDMLRHWNDWKPCFESALGIGQEPPKSEPQQRQRGEITKGSRNPISEFNQAGGVSDVLIRNSYKPAGKDRFIRPGSSSKAPGAVIMRNCADSIERVFSHGGDVLNDGFAHDAFDCMRLLECGGDWAKAYQWNPEITRHNQRLYRLEQQAVPTSTIIDYDSLLRKPAGQDNRQSQTDTGQTKPLFPLIPAPRLTEQPLKVHWLLHNVIEQGSLNLLFGEPGAGKSLFALDWAFCIAGGLDWHGFKTQQADVVIVAGEGYTGFGRRLKALEIKYQQTAPARLFISQHPADFIDEQNIKWLSYSINTTCPQTRLVIIDTMHRNMTGDENSSQDIGRFIHNVDLFLKPLGVAALIVHHSGHGQKDRSRGSSSIRAAMDAEYSALKSDTSITLACHKAKDFEALQPLMFALKPVDLDGWTDDDGEALTSVYLEHQGEARPTTKQRKLSARDDAILTSLVDAIRLHGVEPTADIKTQFGGFDSFTGKVQKIVHIDYWREKAYRVITVDCANDEKKPDALKKAFKRCRDKLFNDGFIVEYGDFVWRLFS